MHHPRGIDYMFTSSEPNCTKQNEKLGTKETTPKRRPALGARQQPKHKTNRNTNPKSTAHWSKALFRGPFVRSTARTLRSAIPNASLAPATFLVCQFHVHPNRFEERGDEVPHASAIQIMARPSGVNPWHKMPKSGS